MEIKSFKFLVLLPIILCLPVNLMAESDGENLLNEGLDFFRTGLYKQAIIDFRDILINPDLKEYHGDGYFWIAKSYMVLGKLSEAEKNLEYYLLNYIGHKDYSEAMYQKGRLLFMQNEYEKAILVMQDFIEKFPNSIFQSNAYFWIGESLFLLGKLDDALVVFKNIVQNYNTSFKYEAAKYRMSIIEFKKRENELLKLLKWSHMESLKSLEEFQRKERTYEQAIASYQKKIAILDGSREEEPSNEDTTQDLRIQRLTEQINTLKNKLAFYEAAPASQQIPYPTTTAETELAKKIAEFEQEQKLKLRLLAVKEEALVLKAELLAFLERTIEGQ